VRVPRFLAVTRRIFMDLKNDKRTLALMFIAPIFAMFVFGLAFSGEVKNLRTEVVNLDRGPTDTVTPTFSLSGMILGNIDKSVLKLESSSSVDAAKAKVENGDAYAVIVFPEGLTENVLAAKQGKPNSENTTVQLYIDQSNVNVANAVVKTVNEALLKTADQAGMKLPVTVDTVAIYGKNARFIDFFVPGIMAFVVFMLTTLLTLVSFVGERTSGTLLRMLATPLRERDIVLGYASAFSVVGILQSAILLLVGILAFHIIIVGNVLFAFVVIALLAVVSQALGILLSSFAKRESQVIQFLPFVLLPTFLLAGIFWPLEAIPSWLRPFSYLVPPTYAVDACRSVMLRGWGLGRIWIDIVALMGFAVAFLALATESLRVRKG
jgi:ABC-2 type transport system permease protein